MNNNLTERPPCPDCDREQVVKNGTIHNGKQKYKCKSCGRQFVKNPTNKRISEKTKEKIDSLLEEKISLAGIVRTTEISKTWLQKYVNKKYANTPRYVQVTEKKKGKRGIECDVRVVLFWK